jgi:uncharacterized UPF0146 family protein
MAKKVPHVEVIGIDLAPATINENDVPSKCRFELDDVNQGLPHFYNQMDVRHRLAPPPAGARLRTVLEY